MDKVSAVLEAEDRNKARAAAGAEESFDVTSPPSEPKSFRKSPDARDPPDVVPCVTFQSPSLTRTSQESESSLPATSVEVIELTLHCQQSGAATDDVNSNASTSVADDPRHLKAAEKPDQEAVSLSEAARSVIAPCASRETSVSAASRATSASRTQPSTAPGPRAVVLSSARVTGPNGLLPLAAYTTSSGPVKSWTPIWNQAAPVVFPASPAATGRPCGSPLTSSPRVHQVESPRMPRQDGAILGHPCQSGPGSPVGSRATHVEGHVFRASQPSSSQHKEVSLTGRGLSASPVCTSASGARRSPRVVPPRAEDVVEASAAVQEKVSAGTTTPRFMGGAASAPLPLFSASGVPARSSPNSSLRSQFPSSSSASRQVATPAPVATSLVMSPRCALPHDATSTSSGGYASVQTPAYDGRSLRLGAGGGGSLVAQSVPVPPPSWATGVSTPAAGSPIQTTVIRSAPATEGSKLTSDGVRAAQPTISSLIPFLLVADGGLQLKAGDLGAGAPTNQPGLAKTNRGATQPKKLASLLQSDVSPRYQRSGTKQVRQQRLAKPLPNQAKKTQDSEDGYWEVAREGLQEFIYSV